MGIAQFWKMFVVTLSLLIASSCRNDNKKHDTGVPSETLEDAGTVTADEEPNEEEDSLYFTRLNKHVEQCGGVQVDVKITRQELADASQVCKALEQIFSGRASKSEPLELAQLDSQGPLQGSSNPKDVPADSSHATNPIEGPADAPRGASPPIHVPSE